jgi:hypothetical protein
MHASRSIPSVLAPPSSSANIYSPPDDYGVNMHERSESPNRRQRISMACQYCRHRYVRRPPSLQDCSLIDRKIRCCGGSPCRNCSRSQRQCEYAPVPEEVNRATREKKAMAKAAKSTHFVSPIPPYSPYFGDSPVYNLPYASPQRPVHLGHRRSVSTPSFDAVPWIQPSAPVAQTPAFEPSQWLHSGWSNGSPVPAYPSVFEPPRPPFFAQQPSTPPESQSGSSEAESLNAWSSPNLHLRVPAMTPGDSRHSPMSPIYYSPHPTPPLYQPSLFASPMHPQVISPTLAPEIPPSSKELVGLGIGLPENTAVQAPIYDHYATPRY